MSTFRLAVRSVTLGRCSGCVVSSVWRPNPATMLRGCSFERPWNAIRQAPLHGAVSTGHPAVPDQVRASSDSAVLSPSQAEMAPKTRDFDEEIAVELGEGRVNQAVALTELALASGQPSVPSLESCSAIAFAVSKGFAHNPTAMGRTPAPVKLKICLRVLEIAEAAGHRLNSSMFSSVIALRVMTGDMDGVEKVVADMRAKGLEPEARSMNEIMSGYCKAGKPAKAMTWRAEMHKQGHRCLPYVTSQIVRAFIRNNQLQTAVSVFKQAASYERDIGTFHMMLNGLITTTKASFKRSRGSKGSSTDGGHAAVENGIQVMHMMLRNGIEPTETTFRILSSLFVAAGRGNEVAQLVRWMRAINSSGVQVTMQNNSADHYVRQGNHRWVTAWFKEQVSLGLEPNLASYAQVIQSFVNAGLIERAVEWFETACTEGLNPGIATYNVVLSGYIRAGRLKEAEEWIARTVGAGLLPNRDSHVEMIQGYSRDYLPADARRWFGQMRDAGFAPQVGDYSSLMQACAATAQWAPECFKLQNEMLSDGITFDTAIFNALMKANLVLGRFVEAAELYRTLTKEGVAPNRTTERMLAKAHVKAPQDPARGVLFEDLLDDDKAKANKSGECGQGGKSKHQ